MILQHYGTNLSKLGDNLKKKFLFDSIISKNIVRFNYFYFVYHVF